MGKRATFYACLKAIRAFICISQCIARVLGVSRRKPTVLRYYKQEDNTYTDFNGIFMLNF